MAWGQDEKCYASWKCLICSIPWFSSGPSACSFLVFLACSSPFSYSQRIHIRSSARCISLSISYSLIHSPIYHFHPLTRISALRIFLILTSRLGASPRFLTAPPECSTPLKFSSQNRCPLFLAKLPFLLTIPVSISQNSVSLGFSIRAFEITSLRFPYILSPNFVTSSFAKLLGFSPMIFPSSCFRSSSLEASWLLQTDLSDFISVLQPVPDQCSRTQ